MKSRQHSAAWAMTYLLGRCNYDYGNYVLENYQKKAISLLENTYVLFGFTSELIFFEHITFKNWF